MGTITTWQIDDGLEIGTVEHSVSRNAVPVTIFQCPDPLGLAQPLFSARTRAGLLFASTTVRVNGQEVNMRPRQ